MATFDVLLPVRNGFPYLAEAIDSIRNQTFPDWRLLILDHGSSDGSLQLAQKAQDNDSRINVFCFPDADGLAGLLNAGLEECDCRYMLRQDSDDISLANRMSVLAQRFRADPGFLAIGSDAVQIDKAGRQIGYHCMPKNPRAIAAGAFFYNPMLHPTVAVDFAAFNRHRAAYGRDMFNLAPETDNLSVKSLAEDYLLFGQMALLGPCANLGVPLVKYRRHGTSVGISNSSKQIELALRVSRFLADSFCTKKDLPKFDPRPFCTHAEYVFDFGESDYEDQFQVMATSLRQGLGDSVELRRELAFRWILATRNSARMATRYTWFTVQHTAAPNEWRTVRNWLLRGVRKGKYVYSGDND